MININKNNNDFEFENYMRCVSDFNVKLFLNALKINYHL